MELRYSRAKLEHTLLEDVILGGYPGTPTGLRNNISFRNTDVCERRKCLMTGVPYTSNFNAMHPGVILEARS